MISNAQLESKWKQIKWYFKTRHRNLNEEDLNCKEGNFDDLLDRLHAKIGKSKHELKEEIRNW